LFYVGVLRKGSGHGKLLAWWQRAGGNESSWMERPAKWGGAGKVAEKKKKNKRSMA